MSQDQGEYKTEAEVITAKDESNDKKYFTITPRIVKAYSRNAYDFALWDTVKDMAGESGECYLNTDQLAILSGMSTGQVSESRTYWLKIGFLKGIKKRDPGYSQAVWHLTVPDLWQRNIEWCEKYPKISARLEFRKSYRSLHRVKPSPHEGKASPGETKNITKEELNVNDRAALLTKLYKENIGAMVPLMIDFLRNAAIDYPDHTWYKDAFEIAVTNSARNWNYVETVLKNWKEKGRGWSPIAEKYNGKNKGKSVPSSAPEVEYDYEALREQMRQSESRQLVEREAVK